MTTFLQFAILGVGTGAAYTLLAQGLLLVYRGSGAINFAQAAQAMVAAFIFWQLIEKSGYSFVPAFLIAVIASTILGIAVYQLLIRPLGPASRLARVIVTLGLLMLLEGVCQLIWGTLPHNIESTLPTNLIEVGGVAIGVDKLILFALAVALTAALALASRFSSIGLAIRANAENARAVSTLGWSPHTLGTLAWALGGALAAVAGVFIAPITAIDTSEMPLMVIPVLAALLIGGLSSFWLTLGGAMIIGISQSLVAKYVTGIPGAVQATPLLIIIVLLLIRGQALSSRSQIAERLPTIGSGKVRLTVLVPAVVVAVYLLNSVFSEELTIAMGISLSWAVVLLSLVVLLGYAGQLSLAQFALGGVAALIAGRLVAAGDMSFVPAFLVAILGTTVLGLLFALPALRVRGISLAIVTLGLGVAVSALLFTNGDLTGGFNGTVVGAQSLFGIDLDTIIYPRRWALFALALFVICGLAVANLRRGITGRRMIAVRTNERAASALGVSVLGVKLYAFGLSAALAGVGGILIAFQNTTILYSQFDPFQSILAVGYSFIGGIGFIFGAPTGATLAGGGFGAWLLNQIFPSASATWLVVLSGVFLIVLALLHPDGIVSTEVSQLHAIGKRLFRRRRATREAKPLPDFELSRVESRRLEIEDVVVRYGGVTAIDGSSLRVEPGEIVGLIGPNGAGKTTLIDTVTGFNRPASGAVRLGGERIDRWSVHRRSRGGLSRSFQSLELFESSTVRENLSVASDSASRGVYATDLVAPRGETLSASAIAAVRELDLEGHLDERVSDLPYGRRRLVAIARAIATTPSVLLLDEPAAGLSSGETQELAAILRRLADAWGFGILVVEHDMTFVMGLCDKVVVLDFGRQIAYGSPAEVQKDPAVIAAYLGGDEETAPPAKGGESRISSATPIPGQA